MFRIVAVWFFCSSAPAYCQYELRSATIVTQSDTLLGQVKFYDWNSTPAIINFFDAQGHEQLIQNQEIMRMRIAPDRIYEGRQLTYTQYSKEENSITAALNGQRISGYFLLELLLQSETVKFYRFFEQSEKKRYFIEKDGVLSALDNVQTNVKANGQTGSYENPLFRNKLKEVLFECPTLNTSTLRYTEAAIINLLKEYHSYCRLDNRVYQEQKDIGKPKISLGLIGSIVPANRGYGTVIQRGASVSVLLPHRFNNFFFMADVGSVSYLHEEDGGSEINLAVYGGRYFGRGALQGQFYTGLSLWLGPLETGIGLSYKKIVSVSASYPVMTQLINGFNVAYSPVYNLRLAVPLTK